MSERTQNARVVGTTLGREDHGIPSCSIDLDLGGIRQGFGGYDLRHHVHFVQRVLDVLGVRRWEDLPGTIVRVKRSAGRAVLVSIGHAIEDKWYTPEDDDNPKEIK